MAGPGAHFEEPQPTGDGGRLQPVVDGGTVSQLAASANVEGEIGIGAPTVSPIVRGHAAGVEVTRADLAEGESLDGSGRKRRRNGSGGCGGILAAAEYQGQRTKSDGRNTRGYARH
jgi:hypothetical protein